MNGPRGRAAIGAETTLAVAALFVTVAGLAHSIGGLGATITAAGVGFVVACLLTVPLVRTATELARRSKEEGAASWLALVLGVGVATTAFTLSGLFAYDAARIVDAKATRAAIRTAILESYDAELSWYKSPGSKKAALLEEWFVPSSAGGERMKIIERAIDRLRRCKRKIGSEAATTTFVSSTHVADSEAEVHTVQSLYQPVFDLHGEKWVEREVHPADLSFSVPDQLYLLKKIRGRWKVQSAPQPQRLQSC